MTTRTRVAAIAAVLVGVGAICYHAFAGPAKESVTPASLAPALSPVAATEKVPLLHIRAIAGEKSGEAFCYVCYRGDTTYALVFVRKWNGMVAGFAKQLEELKQDHPELGVGLVLLDKNEGLADRVRKDLGDAKLEVTTIAVPDGETGWADVESFRLDEAKQTNAIVIANREEKARIAAGCPHCDGVAAKIARHL